MIGYLLVRARLSSVSTLLKRLHRFFNIGGVFLIKKIGLHAKNSNNLRVQKLSAFLYPINQRLPYVATVEKVHHATVALYPCGL